MRIRGKHLLFRYVCPHCLNTFTNQERHDDWFCFSDGTDLMRIPSD